MPKPYLFLSAVNTYSVRSFFFLLAMGRLSVSNGKLFDEAEISKIRHLSSLKRRQKGYERHQKGFHPLRNGFERHQKSFERHQKGSDLHQKGFERRQKRLNPHRKGFEPRRKGFELHRNSAGWHQKARRLRRNGFRRRQKGLEWFHKALWLLRNTWQRYPTIFTGFRNLGHTPHKGFRFSRKSYRVLHYCSNCYPKGSRLADIHIRSPSVKFCAYCRQILHGVWQ